MEQHFGEHFAEMQCQSKLTRAIFIKTLPNKTKDKLMSLNLYHFWCFRIVSVDEESRVDDSEGDIMGNISSVPDPGHRAPTVYHLSSSHCSNSTWRGLYLTNCCCKKWVTK